MDLIKESVNFSALATSDIKRSLFFCEVDQKELVRLVKKFIFTEEKRRKMTLFNETFSVPKPKTLPEDLR